MKKRTIALLCAAIMVVGIAAGGTMAWLVDSTQKEENVFTVGNIDITLEETTENYKMVPGKDIAKDPKVTLSTESENAYVYVEVIESEGLSDYIDYDMNTGWVELTGEYHAPNGGTIYKYTSEVVKGQPISVLLGDKVTTLSSVTKEMMTEAETNQPKLIFYGYAIQTEGFENAEAAWNANFQPAVEP